MTTDRETTRIVRSWMQLGADQLPERVLDAVLDELPMTPQRRSRWPAWRSLEMPNIIKVAAAAVAVLIVVVVVGFRFLPASGGIGGPTVTPVPTPSPTAAPTPSPSPAPTPALFPSGPLPAGSYTIQPFVGPGGLCVGQAGCTEAGAEDDSIRITLTVPNGWAGLENSIVPSVESFSPPGGGGLLFGRGGWLYTVSQVCGGSGPDFPTGPTIPTGTTVDAFVTALVDHPDLDVTSPVDVTLGGHSGKYLELRAPANTTTDGLGPDPSGCNYYFVWEPGIYAQGPNALWRIWVLDVDGVRVVVRSDSFPGTTPEVQSQLAAIVKSIQIES
jgi:hypothetical protein